MSDAAGIARPAGVVGPNAIIQVAAALTDRVGRPMTRAIFADARLDAYTANEPAGMVDERDVAALQDGLRARLDRATAEFVLRDAGLRTADYLLAHRIPALAQRVLKLMPPSLASRVLIAAVGRNSWTFAGSGVFRARNGNPVIAEIEDCPLCRGRQSVSPQCVYYAAVFERLFQMLVSSRTQVTEVACQAMGAPACRFEIGWEASSKASRAHDRPAVLS